MCGGGETDIHPLRLTILMRGANSGAGTGAGETRIFGNQPN
jgi:hypothetical protein